MTKVVQRVADASLPVGCAMVMAFGAAEETSTTIAKLPHFPRTVVLLLGYLHVSPSFLMARMRTDILSGSSAGL